ncbi:MAG TPA: hypothetical protein VFO16_06610 [Pseudonocardiaceae bacterium]|nr:hypothetical protein [Pseudonocardiaceae bacterium]
MPRIAQVLRLARSASARAMARSRPGGVPDGLLGSGSHLSLHTGEAAHDRGDVQPLWAVKQLPTHPP